jgi:cysteine synthase B
MLTTDQSERKDMAAQTRLGSEILDRVGNTPLIRIDGLDERIREVAILGKAEWANPGGSVKDRAAKAIVLDGMERGWIGSDKKKHLLDATSGNTGIACSFLSLW